MENSRWVLITNLKRPFTHKQLQDLVTSLAHVSYFRLNSIKSHCYLEVLSNEEADALISSLQGKVWPECGLPLLVQKIQKSDCVLREDRKVTDIDRKFRKTKTLPHLYWAPVSDEEVRVRDTKRY